MKQKWKETQYIEISMEELFVWWDWLDSFKDTPEKAFDLFTKFLEECEDQLEYSSEVLEEYKEEEYIPVENINDLFDDWETEGVMECDSEKAKYDVPFTPRHNF